MTTELQEHLQTILGGAYTLERELGGGGMSRVFVAEETALGRRVVIKVLAPELAEGLSAERFKREVRLAARLQHPHIVPLLAAGALPGGGLYYTMPYVEGESLRARLGRDGALPLADAVRIVGDVAGALAHAHRAGVVHRDVKPENILIADGGAVVADFGIAKAIHEARAAAGGDVRRSLTLTAEGTSLGTPTYMAPEQALGDLVDHRADLYALGAVAYELLVGRAPFDGRTAQQLLAAHATEPPEPIARRRPTTPPAVAAVVMRLLEKNPADRPQSAEEVLRALEGVTDAPRVTAASDTARPRVLRAAAWALVGVAATAGAVALGAVLAARRAPLRAESAQPIVASIVAPPGHELRPEAGFALSPAGSRLAFVAADARGATAIWIRPLDSLTATRVEGTERGSGPFWSPDGASFGFFAGGQLMVADLRARTRRALCPAPRPGGGAWTDTGDIVYSPDAIGATLFRVPAAGGACTALTRSRPGDFAHRRPSALPGGRRVLFNIARANVVLAADLTTGEISEVRRPGTDGQFARPDWLLFREEDGGPLYAQRLDLATLRTVGEPAVVLDRVSGFAAFASHTVTEHALVTVPPAAATQSLVSVNRKSEVVDSLVVPANSLSQFGAGGVLHSTSHDGRRVALGGLGLWLYDRDRRVATRARVETMAGQGIRDPSWGPGDSLIAYSTVFRGPLMLRVYHAATGTSDSLFASGRRIIRSPDWSPDGRRIAFQLAAGDSVLQDEIWVYSFAERRAARLWEPAGNLAAPRWSPDGRWLAYVSDESGTLEVYVRPASGPGVTARVSTAGGEAPRWRGDGRELYYRAPDGAIMAVGVRSGPALTLSPPRVAVAGPPFSRSARGFEVSPDGEQFVAFEREAPPVFTLVVNWAARLTPP